MYITEPRLDASFFTNVSIDVLANYFSIPLDRDEELSQGIYISKPVSTPVTIVAYHPQSNTKQSCINTST